MSDKAYDVRTGKIKKVKYNAHNTTLSALKENWLENHQYDKYKRLLNVFKFSKTMELLEHARFLYVLAVE